MKLILIIFIFSTSFFINASGQTNQQNYDNDIVNINSAINSVNCSSCNISNFRFWPAYNIPNSNAITKIIKVDFNVIQDENGNQNFIDDPFDQQNGLPRLYYFLDKINHYYNNNPPNGYLPLNVNVIDLPKEFIQFELGEIYFYRSVLYKSSDVGSLLTIVDNDLSRPNAKNDRLQLFFTEGWFNALINRVTIVNGGSGYTSAPIVNFASPCNATATAQISGGVVTGITITNPGTYRFISTNDPLTNFGTPEVFLTGGGGSGALAVIDEWGHGAAAYASFPICNSNGVSSVLAFCAYHQHQTNRIDGDYATSTTLAHELGHNLDLIHTYTGGGTSANCTTNSLDPMYMEDIYGLPAYGDCPHNVSWNDPISATNKIDNNMMGGNREAKHFTPKQIGIMHRALKFKNVRKYLKECYYDPLNPVVISSQENWDFDILNDADININSGASLEIQCHLSMPVGAKIIVNQNATLIVDGILTNNCDNGWSGTIEVKPGGILRLSADAEITLKGNGKILIEDDATNPGKLIFEQGAEVYLDDFTTSIEINGNLEIANNATFEFKHHSSHHGYVKFGNTSQFPSRNINAGSSASINLVGSSTNRTILEIDQETFYAPASLVNFNISGGKVVFNAGSRLQADGSATNINFDNVRFTSNTPGVNNGHRGVHLYGQPNISITSCIFEYGRYGIFAYQTYSGAPLNILNSTFRHNTRGIRAYDKGLGLFQCNFFNNSFGVDASGMSFPSKFFEGHTGGNVASSNITGIKWQSHSNASLILENPLINTNQTGVRAENCPLYVKCGSISYNNDGIVYTYGANLFMDDQVLSPNTAANVSVFNNNYSIRAVHGWDLWLNKGGNELSPSSLNLERTVFGSLDGSALSIAANTNQWNSLGTFAPIDYNLNGNTILLVDNDVQNSIAGCGQAVPPCPNPPCPIQSPLEYCPACDVINTDDFTGVKLNIATKTALDKLNSNDPDQYKDAVALFCQILNEQYFNPDDKEKYLLSLNYIKMMEALGNAFKYNQLECLENGLPDLVNQVITIQDLLITNAVQIENPAKRLKYSLDKAQTLRLACRRTECVDLLNEMLNWVVGDEEIASVNLFICEINIEILLMNGTILNDDVEAYLNDCGGSTARVRNNSEELDQLNPPKQNLEVEVFNKSESGFVEIKTNAENGHLIMMNAIGEVVYETDLIYETTIDVNSLSTGIYFINASNTVSGERMVNKVVIN